MRCPVCGGEVYGFEYQNADGRVTLHRPYSCEDCGWQPEPACGPKERQMEKKRWMWDGQEMHEVECVDAAKLVSSQRSTVRWPMVILSANTRAELYANASKAGCVEVVEPVRCVCGGETLVRSTVCVPGLPWHVDCQACHMQGPAKNTKEQAVEAWNELMGKVKEVK